MSNLTQKVILINAKDRTITEHQIAARGDKHMADMYRLLGCDLFTVGSHLDGANDLFVDDEGLYVQDQSYFQFNGARGLVQLAGNGLVIGYDANTGDSVATTLTVEQVAVRVQWLNLVKID